MGASLPCINAVEPIANLLDWLDGGGHALPPPRAERAFAWTGGGEDRDQAAATTDKLGGGTLSVGVTVRCPARTSAATST